MPLGKVATELTLGVEHSRREIRVAGKIISIPSLKDSA